MKIKSLILFLSLLLCTMVSVRADNSLVKFPEWILKEKIRAGCMGDAEGDPYATLMRVNGLNTAIVGGNLHRKNEFKKALQRFRHWGQVGKKRKLHVFISYYWQPSTESDYRRVVYSNGTTGIAPCPRDDKFWQNHLIHLGKVIAELSLEPDVQIGGIFLDCELYGSGSRGFKNYGECTCFCDDCFSSFLLARGFTGPQLPAVEYDDREKWLRDNQLLDNYFAFMEKDVESLAKKYERIIHWTNPSLILGMYPTPKNWVLQSISRGFGTADFPMIIFATDTYEGGGHQRIPDDPEQFYRNSGIHTLYAAGFLLRCYGSDRLGVNLYTAAEKCSGYWLFRMPMLWGDPLAKDLAKGTASEYWRSISLANDDIDMLVGQTSTPNDTINMLLEWKLLSPSVLGAERREYKLPEARFRRQQDFLIYANRQQEAKIDMIFKKYAEHTKNLNYKVISPEGQSILIKEISEPGSIGINFKPPVSGVYLLTVKADDNCMFMLNSSNSPVGALDISGFYSEWDFGPLYFYVSAQDKKVVILGEPERSEAKHTEALRVTIEGPEGEKLMAETKQPRNNGLRLELGGSAIKPGVWRLSVTKTDGGTLRNAYLNFLGLHNVCLAFREDWIFVRD